MPDRRTFLSMGIAGLALAGCVRPPDMEGGAEVAKLAGALMAMGPQVDPEEAERAARVAYARTHELAIAYQITDPPLVHNTKVNMGLRPRGLCWHWADDMEARLREERFATLRLHRAIANADNAFRIDHSTVILAAAGDSLFDGMVLDPWRKGGRLTWAITRKDTDYKWVARNKVFEELARRRAGRA
ncbi:MAG: hypothetical protein AAF631_06970 [Pseudomonadota bacterium]